jgi:ribose/xylose/arabinose/galactoside ABC-type transport system permease subunit
MSSATTTPAASLSQPTEAVRFSFTRVLPLALAAVLILAYLVLPWVNQTELGATTASVLTAARANNEIGMTTNGLALVPMGAVLATLGGVWALISSKSDRAAGILAAAGGLFIVQSFIIVFTHASGEGIDLAAAAGLGFWLALALGAALVIQALIPRPSGQTPLGKTFGNQEAVLGAALVVLVLWVGLANPRFVAERNLSDVLQGNAYIAVAAVGMALVIISGNIDISVGSLVGVLATISGSIAVMKAPDGSPILPLEILIPLAWGVPILVGGLAGALNGFLVAYLKIPSIIVTLGMLSILQGGLIMVTGGNWIDNLPEGYALAQMRPLGIPMPIVLMVVMTIGGVLFLKYTPFGRSLYAVGGNKEAARLSGISERRVVMGAFIGNGMIVGVAAVLYATQLSVIQSTVPPNLELLIITASVVGGISILGGTGTVFGAALAAILLNAIRSSMVFINVSPFWLQSVQGVLVLLTVLADLLRRRRQL